MILDVLMFDRVMTIPFAVTFVCVRYKASVCPRVSDDVAMRVIVKGGAF